MAFWNKAASPPFLRRIIAGTEILVRYLCNFPDYKKIILLLVFSFLGFSQTALAAEVAAKARVAVESFDRTIATDIVDAKTFGEAIASLAEKNSLEIISSFDEKTRLIQSIGGVSSHTFSNTDGWFGYIERDGNILRPDNIMDEPLVSGDYAVLYYGEKGKTEIVLDISVTTDSDIAKIHIKSINSETGLESGLYDAKVHLITPNGGAKIVKTDKNGTASTKLDKTGVYKYYAESYEIQSVPRSVRTRDSYMLFGVSDPENVTRAEAAAFIVNNFNVPLSTEQNPFNDVDRTNPFYSEINTAAAAGIIHGYEDGSFDPDGKVNLLELGVMLSGLYKNSGGWNTSPSEIPNWAAQRISYSVRNEALKGVEKKWSGAVNSETLLRIYFNRMGISDMDF